MTEAPTDITGFAKRGYRTAGGWIYVCDGRPTPHGCETSTLRPRRIASPGLKSDGWLVLFGLKNFDEDDSSVVLTYCPGCAVVVASQEGHTLSCAAQGIECPEGCCSVR